MTKSRRWSDRLEGQRAGAETAAQEAAAFDECAISILARAEGLVRSNPDLAEKLIAQAATLVSRSLARQERIQRFMAEAKNGL